MRKIGSITPIWNQEMFLKPHFEMLSKLDRNVVILQNHPLGNYWHHGIGDTPDRSKKILEKYFPNVEVYRTKLDVREFSAALYNEGLEMMQDCDIVLRLDPDMLFVEKEWDDIITNLRNSDYDCYRMDFKENSINYYMTWDYEHGLKDADEHDALAVNPKQMFTGVLDYPDNNQIYLTGDYICHHLRGWNKPNTVPDNWKDTESARIALNHTEDRKWHKLPQELIDKMEDWRKELETI